MSEPEDGLRVGDQVTVLTGLDIRGRVVELPLEGDVPGAVIDFGAPGGALWFPLHLVARD